MSERFIMFFVEEIIVMGTVIEVNTHPVKDEEEGRKVIEGFVGNIIDDKWLIRLIEVDEMGLFVIEERSSYQDDK
jgi:hypothetical protein